MKKPIREFVKSGIWYKYILDEMLYPETDMTDEEKVTEFLKNAYSAEKYAIANRRSRIVDLYADYLMGLPTGVECIYWDDGMIAQVEEFTGRHYTRSCDRSRIAFSYPKVMINHILFIARYFGIDYKGEKI